LFRRFDAGHVDADAGVASGEGNLYRRTIQQKDAAARKVLVRMTVAGRRHPPRQGLALPQQMGQNQGPVEPGTWQDI
jgi:hypothetical protein